MMSWPAWCGAQEVCSRLLMGDVYMCLCKEKVLGGDTSTTGGGYFMMKWYRKCIFRPHVQSSPDYF